MVEEEKRGRRKRKSIPGVSRSLRPHIPLLNDFFFLIGNDVFFFFFYGLAFVFLISNFIF